ncbi:ribosome silencing factor [Bacteroidota bacterium]
MNSTSRGEETEQLVAEIINGLREKKGKEIVTLDLRKINNAVTEFYVICSGDSSTHVQALAGSVEEGVKKVLKERPWHVEGVSGSEWVLLDYVNVVVHVFQKAPRRFYDIEGLWADAVVKEYEEMA